MKFLVAFLLHLISFCLATTIPPVGSLVVPTTFKTIQAAVDIAKDGQTIFIEPGTYHEQIFVPENKKYLVLMGSSSSMESYMANKVTIQQGRSQADKLNNDQTGTLRAHGEGLKVYNLNLVNTKGKGSQALALSAYGDKQGYYGCQFKGFQDTILSEKGHQYFAHSYIEGATDFIFGQHAQTWFEACDIRVTAPGWITANGRDASNNPSYYVLNKCNINGPDSVAGKAYLGRPWREFSRVVFQNSKLGGVINKDGWAQWSNDKPNTAHIQWGEFGNSGAGASKTRKFGKILGAAVGLDEILPQASSWVDGHYKPN